MIFQTLLQFFYSHEFVFTLFKKDSGVAWDKFEAIGDKEQLKELKKDSLAAYDKLNENLQEERKSCCTFHCK